MRFFNTCFLIICLGIMMPGTALSAKYAIHDEATFKDNTKPYHEVPFNNPKFEFSILLPKDWSTEPVPQVTAPQLSQKILSNLVQFKSPMIGTDQAIITIQSVRLDREISAENWLKNYVFTNGHSVQDKVTPYGAKKAGVSFVSVFEGKAAFTYAVLQINGNIAMMARFEIPLTLKEPLAFLQKQTIDSFKLIMDSGEPVELQRVFSLSDAMKITYPESWTLHYPDIRDTHNMSVQIHNGGQDGTVDGLIRFVAVRRSPKTNLLNEMRNIKKYFEDFLGVEFKQMTSSEKAPVYNRFIFSRYETYNVTTKKNNTDQELRFVVLGDKDWYIILFLMTPTENNELYTWACNTQAFDLVVKNLK